MKKNDLIGLKSNPKELNHFLKTSTVSDLLKLLKNFGYINKEFDYQPLLSALKHSNDKIRSLIIKNLAKSKDTSLINLYEDIVNSDKSNDVKKEAVSAIGRTRNEKVIPILTKYLKHKNPEIVLQAIRGLLVFKTNLEVSTNLKKLNKHKNEIVRKVINIEFGEKKTSKKNDQVNSPSFLKNLAVHGDVLQILKNVPEESVHLTFTSPPYYNARDYSIYESYEEYLEFLSSVFNEVHRITKEGRFFILNTSPIIIPRVGRKYSSIRYPIPYDIHTKIINNGWEFIDDIVWVKNEASVINRNGGFFQYRKPLSYKPNARTESVMVYRKKTNKLIDWNIDQYPEKIIEESKIKGKYESSNVWEIDPSSDKNHSAVFPEELCNRIISFYSFIGDLIFDPFGGRGTVGKTAQKLKRNYFLTEIDEKYFNFMKKYIGEKKGNNFISVEQFNEFKKDKEILR